jgi:hypothetical protein
MISEIVNLTLHLRIQTRSESMPQQTYFIRYPFELTTHESIMEVFAFDLVDALVSCCPIALLVHFCMTYDSCSRYLQSSSPLQRQLFACTRQHPAFMSTPWSFPAVGSIWFHSTWFHSYSNMDSLVLVLRTLSVVTVAAIILFFQGIIDSSMSHCSMRIVNFVKAFYGDQIELFRVHLDAEENSVRICLRLQNHGSQRELERSMDDINRRGEREARMNDTIGRGQSELLLMTRRTRRIARFRKGH